MDSKTLLAVNDHSFLHAVTVKKLAKQDKKKSTSTL